MWYSTSSSVGHFIRYAPNCGPWSVSEGAATLRSNACVVRGVGLTATHWLICTMDGSIGQAGASCLAVPPALRVIRPMIGRYAHRTTKRGRQPVATRELSG